MNNVTKVGHNVSFNFIHEEFFLIRTDTRP